MISRHTGAIEARAFCLEPRMLERELFEVVREVERLSAYAGWTHYAFRMEDWSVVASFRSGRLGEVSITHSPPGETPAAGSERRIEREQERKIAHDRFLRHWLGWSLRPGPRRFPWGRVESLRDPMTGEASITVSYER